MQDVTYRKIEDGYKVLYCGIEVGRVYRHDHIPVGYTEAWYSLQGGFTGTSRQEVARKLVNAYKRRINRGA